MRRALWLACLGLCLAAPASAPATYEELGSGTTSLTLGKGFLAEMKRSGVTLEALAPAKLKGTTATFPIAGGRLDPTDGVGFLHHEGVLVLRAGSRSIPIKALMVKTTQRRSPLSAKVGGSQLKLGTAKSTSTSRAGFATKVGVRSLTLSEKVAGRLAKKLRLPEDFGAAIPFASARSTAVPAAIALRNTGRVSFTPDPAFRAKLDSLFVALNPVFPAERPGGEFTFPILRGTLATDAASGVVETLGALDGLQLGGGQVFWSEPRLDLGSGILTAELEVRPSPPYRGAVGRSEIATLSVLGAALGADPKARSITLAGASLALTATAAAAFDEAYAGGRGVFAAGERLGSLSFTGMGE